MSDERGETLFRSLARQLATAFPARFALISECTDASCRRVRSLAFRAGSEFGKGFEYDVAGAPCEDVLRRGQTRFFPDGVQSLFPEDRDLRELGIRSYLGAPIAGSSGRVVGHVAVMDVATMRRGDRQERLLRRVAARAGLEIERRRAERSPIR